MKNQTFENFYRTEANAYVIDMLRAVAKGALSPHIVLLYGPNSAGKTHLLRALQNAAVPETVLYTTADGVTFDLINAIKAGTESELSRKIEETDILLIDDAQFLAGRELTQEFLIDRDYYGTVVIATDREIENLQLFRARSNLPVLYLELEPPDFSARTKIVEELSEDLGMAIREEGIHEIAGKTADVREITGLIKTRYATHNSL